MDVTRLEKYRQRLYSRVPLLGPWLRRQAVQALVEDGSAAAVRALAAAASDGPDVGGRTAAVEALQQIARGGSAPAGEALCRLVLYHDQPLARQAVLAADYSPRDETQRALFFFLTEQWERYEDLDFDHHLLRLAYEHADKRLRGRIAARARQAGRIEWVEIAAGGHQGRRLGSMTDREWKAALSVLAEGDRWQELWRLVQEAPPRWSVHLLRRLQEAGWTPPGEDRNAFAELAGLAEQVPDEDLRPRLFCRTVLRGHRDAVRCLSFSPDGQLLASGSADKTLRLWSMPEGRRLAILKDHRGPVTCLAMSPTGRLLASGGRDGIVRLWSLAENRLLGKLKGHSQMITCLGITPDGRLLASGSADGSAQLWGLPSGEPGKTLTGHESEVVCLAIGPHGTTLATGGADSCVRLWSLPQGRSLRTLSGHRADDQDAVLCLAISPGGDVLASGGSDETVRLWGLPGGGALRTLTGHRGAVTSVAFSPRGDLLASGAGDYHARLWRVADGRALAKMEGHASEVTSLVISADGRYLASASGSGLCLDPMIRVWSLPEGEKVKILPGHTRYVTCLALAPDGGTLASGSGDGTIRLWTPELDRLSRLPLKQITLQDLAWVEETLQSIETTEADRPMLGFMAALLRRHRRLDIMVEEAGPRVIEIGAFDIEIEG